MALAVSRRDRRQAVEQLGWTYRLGQRHECIAIVAGLNWLTHCAKLAGVDRAQHSGTLRHFRKLVTLAQLWWLNEGAVERCAQMLARQEQPPLMLYLIWSEYTRLAKQITAAAIFPLSTIASLLSIVSQLLLRHR